MKNILVPCDFSDPAMQAFKFASEIASISKGEIFLLNIVEVPTLHNSMFVPVQAYEGAFVKELTRKAGNHFEKMKDKWAKNAKIHLVVEQGSVTNTINKFVKRKGIDLIVMGTHGSSGFREFATGSNTEKIVRLSGVPVIAVRLAPKVASIKDIIFPTHLDLEPKELITSVKALQNFLKAKLHILYVNTPGNFAKDISTEKRLNDFAKTNVLKNYTINVQNDIDVESGIITFSSRFKNKMIAMSTHGRKGLSHLLSGSIAEDMVNHIQCPIWTYADLKK